MTTDLLVLTCPWCVDRRGAATLEEAEARMLSRKHAHQRLNSKLAALASKGASFFCVFSSSKGKVH